MPTIKDVAKKAGVSISTASYALNHLPNVHPETRKRVFLAAEELNYYPNGSAKNLKKRKTGNIGVFIYGFSGPIFSDVLEGIRHKLQENNYNIIVSSGKSSTNLLQERQVDGAVIFDAEITDLDLSAYASHGVPIIVLDRKLEGPNIYSSVIENDKLVYQFVNQMIKKGYHDFAYVSGPLDAFNNNQRYEGFKKALKDKNITNHQYYQGDFTIQSGYEAGLEIIKRKDRPKFVFCANDESAIGLIQALNEANINIPDEIALSGFDNIYLGQYIKPKLTTIGINHILWGEKVAEAMINIVSGHTVEKIEKPVGEIYERETC
ncbi:LacI family DNA-binding transcriptional regulator [Peloplasma aerotolerans]|uniref:LacI family DNA-binding transcriptional regulator n=1 Tax=Peloplasma aerotolerans TaxID=3044389 RepID=A0AAW6U5U7_9MOLU|nr:LacI family DNA-binding transcriptional regulator [Mariniplasma sp. M4Ah]MDI6452290.1 LacI family DNA-binding transcriptional regulator [Mariniplasma sp. M4Ah]